MIRIMLNYARSGGTLLNKCLGSLPDVVMLSELNPLGGGWGPEREKSLMTIWEQADKWYGIKIKSKDFVDALIELDERCSQLNKHLIIRDWTSVNFIPFPENQYIPSNKLMLPECLDARVDYKIFAMIRDSIDIWISRGKPDINQFYSEYRKYIQSLLDKKIPLFKYEDFTKAPETELKKICALINLPYDTCWINKYPFYNKAHGDTQLQKVSRGAAHKKIQPLRRKNMAKRKIDMINQSVDMKWVNKKMGYKPYYSPNYIQHNIFNIKRKLSGLI